MSKSARDIHLACESSLSKLLSRWDDLRAVDVRGWILAAALSRGAELCAWKLVERFRLSADRDLHRFLLPTV